MIHHRLVHLRNKHRALEQRLHAELRRPDPDSFVVQDLKRQKLQVKDEIFLAEAGLEPVRL